MAGVRLPESTEREVDAVSFTIDRADDFTRQVRNALEDEAAQPLSEVRARRPRGLQLLLRARGEHQRVELWLRRRLGAGAHGRPAAVLERRGGIAESSRERRVALFSDQSWTALMAEDRAQRGAGRGRRGAPSDLGAVHAQGRAIPLQRREQRAAGGLTASRAAPSPKISRGKWPKDRNIWLGLRFS